MPNKNNTLTDDTIANLGLQGYTPQQHWEILCKSLPKQTIADLEPAFALILKVHASQYRKRVAGDSPVPFAVHPIRVARVLVEEWERADSATLLTAFFHDVLEDCEFHLLSEAERRIREIGGTQILNAVTALSKPRLPYTDNPETKAQRNAEYFRNLRNAPDWVRLVKCADRLDNLRDALGYGDLAFWRKYSSETIGWHLYLAKFTDERAEKALYEALVEGERQLTGREPFWADGHLVDPQAAKMIPEHLALRYQVVGLAKRGSTLLIGYSIETDVDTIVELRPAICSQHPEIIYFGIIPLSAQAINEAHANGLFASIHSTVH